MPRKRMLDPGFWDDLDVARLSHMERLLLIGMVSMADDYGHLQASPLVLRKQIFGYDEVTVEDVEAARDSVLTHCRNVTLYRVDGQEYIELRRWSHYQKLNYTAAPQFPAPKPAESDLAQDQPEAEGCVRTDSGLTQDCEPSRLSRLSNKKVKKDKKDTTPTECADKSAPTTADWERDFTSPVTAYSGAAIHAKRGGRWLAWYANLVNKAKFHGLGPPDADRLFDAYRKSPDWKYSGGKSAVADNWGKWLASNHARASPRTPNRNEPATPEQLAEIEAAKARLKAAEERRAKGHP